MIRDPDVPFLTALRRRCADPRGFALTEVLVAAAVFAMLSMAVLAGVDGASSSTGREKARSVASALAEKEQERMHSVPALELPGYYSKVTKTVGGIVYTIESEADWVTDLTGGTISCVSKEGKADYLKLRTTVSSDTVGTSTAPVQIDSLLAPPPGSAGGNNGTLAVQVNNRDGEGVPGIRVDILGAGSAHADAENTNALGCAIFAGIPADTYDVGFSQLNWVDPEGTLNPHYSAIVTAGATTLKSILYDAKGKVVTGFDTKYWDVGAGTWATEPSKAWALAAANTGVKSGLRIFEVPGTVQSQFTADYLFPFKDGYGLYSGRCAEQNPNEIDPVYGPTNAFQLVDRNSTYDRVAGAKPLRQPAIAVRVADGRFGGSGTYKNRPKWIGTNNVMARLVPESGSTCVDSIPSYATSSSTGLRTLSYTGAGVSRGTSSLNYEDGMYGFVTKGGTFDPGLPWGRWQICADNGSRRQFVTINNNAWNGTDLKASTAWPTNYTVLDVSATGYQAKTCAAGAWPAPS